MGYFFSLTLEPFHPPRNPPFLEQARKKPSAPAALEPWAVEWELRVRSIFYIHYLTHPTTCLASLHFFWRPIAAGGFECRLLHPRSANSLA